jgi:hypothetical protein
METALLITGTINIIFFIIFLIDKIQDYYSKVEYKIQDFTECSGSFINCKPGEYSCRRKTIESGDLTFPKEIKNK